jgi:probable rRNA maturation factor
LEIIMSNDQRALALTKELEQAILTLGALAEKKLALPPGAEVSVVFTDDETIRSYNASYRGVDAPTDVLSFAMREGMEMGMDDPPTEELLGDILISLPRALEQSRAYGHELIREVGFLFTHGLLHLLGYDHAEPAAETQMSALQEELLLEAGFARQPS